MSCGCNKEGFKRPERTKKVVRIEGLYKHIDSSPCSLENKKAVYPKTVIQAVFDGYTGRRLDSVLAMGNSIYLPWQGCFKETLRKIPKGVRRRGLIITTVDGAGQVFNKQYVGSCSNECQDITDPRNWKDVNETRDTYYKPKSLRQEGDKLIFESVDDRGKIVALQTPLEGMFKIQVTDASIIDHPEMANENTIYLVPNELAPGTHREFVKYSKIENGRVVHKMEQLGSASGICSKLSKPDKYLKDTVFVDGVLKQRVGFSPEVDPDGSLDTVIETPLNLNTEDLERLKDKVSALENKEDKDTIFDPSEINKKIGDLEKKIPSAEVLNTINNRIETLESKPDKDTVFDPSSLLSTIEDLKKEIQTLKDRTDNDDYVISGKWIDDDTVELTLKNNNKVLIAKSKVETWRELEPKKVFDSPLPVEWKEELDPDIFEGETKVIRNSELGYHTIIEEEQLINGKPTGVKRVKSDTHTPGVAELRVRGGKHRPVISSETVNESEVIEAGNGEDRLDPNLDEGIVNTIDPVNGLRVRTVTYQLIDGVRQPNPTYSDWTITKTPTNGYRVVGTRKKPEVKTYNTYLGKYPHFSGIGEPNRPITAADIKALTLTVAHSPEEVFKNITVVSNENSKFSYAYPKELGPVSRIIDGSNDNIRENFDETTINIDGIDYLVYTIAGAFGSTRKRQEIPFTFVK